MEAVRCHTKGDRGSATATAIVALVDVHTDILLLAHNGTPFGKR